MLCLMNFHEFTCFHFPLKNRHDVFGRVHYTLVLHTIIILYLTRELILPFPPSSCPIYYVAMGLYSILTTPFETTLHILELVKNPLTTLEMVVIHHPN